MALLAERALISCSKLTKMEHGGVVVMLVLLG